VEDDPLTDLIAALVAFLIHPTTLLLGGGALGTWARFGVSEWFKERGWSQSFPWGTFAINVSGSFVLAIAFVLIRERLPPERWKWFLLVGTGFCGGYTTFSTYSWETFELAFVRKQPWMAAAYSLSSVVAGLAGAGLGWAVAEAIFPRGT
jgi:CrcB protein